jgi:hypothetical protein
MAPSGIGGYWLGAADGGIFTFGTVFYGSGLAQVPQKVTDTRPISSSSASIDSAASSSISRYRLQSRRRKPHPDRPSMGGTKLAAPIMGMALDESTGGYWLVGADGGIFSSNAPFYGAH